MDDEYQDILVNGMPYVTTRVALSAFVAGTGHRLPLWIRDATGHLCPAPPFTAPEGVPQYVQLGDGGLVRVKPKA